MQPNSSLKADPYPGRVTINLSLQDGVVVLEPSGLVKVPQGAVLNWTASSGMSAVVEFIDSSPFPEERIGSETPRVASIAGRHRYLCFLEINGKRLETLIHMGDEWGGEVEVSPTGRGTQ